MCDVPLKEDVQSLCSLVLATELCATLQGQVAVRSSSRWQSESAPSQAVQGCSSQSGGLPLQPTPLQHGKQDACGCPQDLYWIMDVMEPWHFNQELRHFKLCAGKIKVFALSSNDIAKSRKRGEIHYGPKAVCKTSHFHLQFPFLTVCHSKMFVCNTEKQETGELEK